MAKQKMIEEEYRGWSSIGDKYVCDHCFGDYALQEVIRQNLCSSLCDYCGRSADIDIAAPIDIVMEHIADGIYTEWDHPVNSVGWNSSEGGWIGATIYDTYEVLEQADLEVENEVLIEDIANSFLNTEWCEDDPYASRPSDQLFYDWESFCDLIKHQNRYFFFEEKKLQPGRYRFEQNPFEILLLLDEIVRELGLILNLPEETSFFRGRPHETSVGYSSAKDLGPPSPIKAKYSNRMSAAGIPMFYGSENKETAIAEITHNYQIPFASIGVFRTLRNLKVIDLSKIPSLPSLFDEERRHFRSSILFMRDFVEDFTKPIERDNTQEHIEYVPTQVVTEYFRHVFRDNEDYIDGIVYPSSCHDHGRSCVLFLTQEDCDDNRENANQSEATLLLISSEVLSLSAK